MKKKQAEAKEKQESNRLEQKLANYTVTKKTFAQAAVGGVKKKVIKKRKSKKVSKSLLS